MELPRPLMAITLKLHPIHTSHFFTHEMKAASIKF